MFFKPMLLPLLAMVALTFVVWMYMYITRFREMARKNIDPQDLDTHAAALALLTESSGPASNLRNLFELPVLFYLAVVLTLVLLIQDSLLIALSWAFVLLRAVHSFVHCTYNRVLHRFTAYAASCVVLFLMWAQLGWYVISN
jgi:hypothetical protein